MDGGRERDGWREGEREMEGEREREREREAMFYLLFGFHMDKVCKKSYMVSFV